MSMVDDLTLVLTGYQAEKAAEEIAEAGVPTKYGDTRLSVLDTRDVPSKAFTAQILALAGNYLEADTAIERIGATIAKYRLAGTATLCCENGCVHVWAWSDGKQVIDGWETGLIREMDR